jgi:hypothetical protein
VQKLADVFDDWGRSGRELVVGFGIVFESSLQLSTGFRQIRFTFVPDNADRGERSGRFDHDIREEVLP